MREESTSENAQNAKENTQNAKENAMKTATQNDTPEVNEPIGCLIDGSVERLG